MKTAALFLALSLSIVSIGCGKEPGGASSLDDGSMTGKDSGKLDDPFAGSACSKPDPGILPGKLMVTAIACKMNTYFYESEDKTGKKGIACMGLWNKNNKNVNAFFYEEPHSYPYHFTEAYMFPDQKASTNQLWVESGAVVRIETETGVYPNFTPCEIVRVTMPPQ